MKRPTFFVALLLMLFSISAFSQTKEYTYHFEKPKIDLKANGYSNISYKDCANLGKEGTPLLPQFAANILLPPGTEIVSVNIKASEYYPEEKNGIILPPASRQFPISKGAPKGYHPVADNKIYASASAYPGNCISSVSTNFLNGHSIGSFAICPLIYYPSLKEVRFIKELKLEVVTKSTERASTALDLLRSNERINQRIKTITQHNELISNYDAMVRRDNPTYDILLITKNEFLPYFNEYVAYKQSTGYAVICKTAEDIYSQYSGTDNPMKIRNCIIDYYQNFGASYVILAGDADPNNSSQNVIPKRGLDADPGSGYEDTDIPSDMYYACLDGTWNTDNDNKWGEPDEADLYFEVGIGRLCVDSQTEIQNFINKLMLYQSSPVVADIKKGLMIGEQLDGSTYGDDSKDEIVSGGNFNGYTTAGFPASFTISRLYESLANWEKENVFNQFNTTGTHLLNHLGHSNVDYNMKMYNSDVTTTNFQNDGVNHGFAIGYSQGCYNGSFDNRDTYGSFGIEDCFAEQITNLATAEVAAIANGRYGWYEPSGTNGASQFFDRQFFDAIFGENIFLIGDVNSDSKEDNVSYINSDGVIRWCAYETNLFGDPTMDIWTDTPADIVATYPASVSVGISQIAFQTNTPFARIGLMQSGSLIGRGLADASGNATITLAGPISNVDPISVSIIGHNRNRHQGNIVVISDQPYVVYQSNQINDASGNNNGQLDPGEVVTLNLGLQNVGTQPATNVNVTLETTNANVSITDAMENYGDFAAGQTKTINDGFALTVSNSIPDQQVINFNVQAVGESTWSSIFNLVANAPVLTVGAFTIDDSQGNGNGRLDPGETATLSVVSLNNGHADALSATGTLTSGSSLVTVSNPVYTLGTLAIGQSATAQFTIQVDASATTGAVAILTYSLTSGAYQVDKDYYAKIGLILEDWETGNFTQFNWQQGGSSPWAVVNTGAYEGTYCSKSGNIGNSSNSDLTISINVAGSDSISFYRKVSSESDYDFLKFYIDNNMQEQWSGEQGWTKVSYPVTAGNHIFKWTYVKDSYQIGGSDCAWLDYIVLPAPLTTTAYAGSDATICSGETYICSGTATNYTSVSWTTSGTGTFSDATILNPVYTPSQADIDNGSVELTITVQGEGEPKTDNMRLTINAMPVIAMTETGLVCENESYAVTETSVTNYFSIEWTTSGTGTFNDPNALNPVYTPSQEDITAGSAILTLTATGNAPCGATEQSMTLTIIQTPSVTAGEDAEICENLTYTLQQAAAEQYSSLLWITTGTGTFSDATILNPVYTPSQEDLTIGQVVLTLQATGNAPCTAASDDLTLMFKHFPETPSIPSGTDQVDIAYSTSSVYTIDAVANANAYTWMINPESAGTLAASETSVEITWNTNFIGNVSLSVKATNDCGDGTVSDPKVINVINTTGIGENPGLGNLNIYPNPSDGDFTLQMNAAANTNLRIRIFNMYGVEIYNNNIVTNGSYPVHLNSVESGMYLLEAKSNDGCFVGRVIIKK